MRTQRIVKRQNMRQQLSDLKDVVKTTKPLIEADKQLRRAYMAGYKKRLTEEIEEAKQKEQAFKGEMTPEQVDAAVNQELDTDELVKGVNAVPTNEKEQIRDVLVTKHPEVLNIQEQNA